MFSNAINMVNLIVTSMISFVTLMSCNIDKANKTESQFMSATYINSAENLDTATFGTGCFWCTEAIFQRLEGVSRVVSGYSGGQVNNPSYEQVCTGTTGHAECCQVVYDPSVISFDELLSVFWKTHDPTTLNRQGNDIGTQYRSAIFFHDDEQKQKAEHYIQELNNSGAYDDPIVTTLEPYTTFYSAEDYHKNYYNNNRGQSYCRFVIQPKIEKFEKVFKEKLKSSSAD